MVTFSLNIDGRVVHFCSAEGPKAKLFSTGVLNR